MKINQIILVASLVVFLSMSFMKVGVAGGLDNHNIGLRGIGMGNSLHGVSHDASAVYFNPGGLAFLEEGILQGEVYIYFGAATCEYSAEFGTERSNEPFLLPGFFMSKTYEDWAWGLGVYIPYAGGGTAYDDFQNSGFDRDTVAGWAGLTFSAAYKLYRNLSIGAGITAYGGMLEMKNQVVDLEYDGFSGYGGHIGLMYNPTKTVSIGLVARSEVDMDMDGTLEMLGTKNNSNVEFTVPSAYSLGIGYKHNNNLTVGVSATYSLYGDMTELVFKSRSVDIKMPTYFTDCWLLGMGMEYFINNKTMLSAGLKYVESATKNKGLSAEFCDVSHVQPCFGIGYDIKESLELNFAASVAFGVEEEYNSQKFDRLNYLLLIGIRFKL